MSQRETFLTGGALTERTTTVTMVDDAAGFADMMRRLRAEKPLAAQIVDYFEQVKQRLSEVPGVVIGANLVASVPWGPLQRDQHTLLAEEFGELRDSLFHIVAGPGGVTRRLAPAAQLDAVARAHRAGQLAHARHVFPKQPATETGIRVDEHLAGNREKAAKAKAEAADIWRDMALEIARSKVVPTKAYSANAAAPDVRLALSELLPTEFQRLGLEYDEARHLPSSDTIRKAIPASKIVGRIA